MLFRTTLCVIFTICLTFVSSNLSVAQDDIVREKTVSRLLTVVKPEIDYAEGFSPPRDLRNPVSKKYKPNRFATSNTLEEQKKRVIMRHDVGCLEFTYKSLRILEVDVPQITGKMQRKTVFYLIYRIRNIGNHLSHKQVSNDDGSKEWKIEKADQISTDAKADVFQAHFVLEGWSQNLRTRTYQKKAYLDRYLPTVVKQIEAYDKTEGKLHDSIAISKMKIPVEKGDDAKGVWGVAVWEDVDPKMNYIQVYVRGLTNAFKVEEKLDGSKIYEHKTLQLNFWRKDDEFELSSENIAKGIPLSTSLKEQKILCRFYDLPGPIIQVSEFNPETNRRNNLFSVDSQYDKKFNSLLALELANKRLPKDIRDRFAVYGFDIPGGVTINETIKGIRWEFIVDGPERKMGYQLDLIPTTWRKVGEGVEILRRVDNIWVYR